MKALGRKGGSTKGGQASLEFMAVMTALMVVFVLVGYTVYSSYVKGNDLRIYINGQRLTNHLADHINAINAVSDGQATHMSLPGKLYGDREYFVRFYDGESSVFVDGGEFTTGRDTLFSSPITTENVGCLVDGCASLCNRTADEICLNVTSDVQFRVAKYNGGVYLTRRYNVMQDGVNEYIEPFEGEDDFNIGKINDYADPAGAPWNIIYLYKNTKDRSLSLVFSLNMSGGDRSEIHLQELTGEVLSLESNDAGELVLERPLNQPDIRWEIGAPPSDNDGGVIRFRDGLNLCLEPVTMPASNWVVRGYGGKDVILDKSERVCITYP